MRVGVRWLAVLVLVLIPVPTWASPADVGWATIGIGLGASPVLSGGIAERLEREPCGSECPLSSRMIISGGVGRWGIELHVAGNPVDDTRAMDGFGSDRHALRVGPLVRYSLVRRYGFDVGVRGGVQYGGLSADGYSTYEYDATCMPDHPCTPHEVEHDGPSYSLWALPVGATVRFGVRSGDGGYFALFADVDYALVHIAFPDDGRFGALRTVTYGFTFGSMFDLR